MKKTTNWTAHGAAAGCDAIRGDLTLRRPTDGYFASFAYRLRNVLFVSIDEFDELAAGESVDPWTGTLRLRVDGEHLQWLAEVLAAADAVDGGGMSGGNALGKAVGGGVALGDDVAVGLVAGSPPSMFNPLATSPGELP